MKVLKTVLLITPVIFFNSIIHAQSDSTSPATDTNRLVEPVFVLDTTKSDLRFLEAKYGGTFYFTINGKRNDEENTNEFVQFSATQSPMQEQSFEELKDLHVRITRGMFREPVKIRHSSDRKINGFKAYEMEIDGRGPGYLCIVQIGDNLVVMIGMAFDNYKDKIPLFRKFARTIRAK